jgi:hypothetical protein
MAAKCETGITVNDNSISLVNSQSCPSTYDLHLNTTFSKLKFGPGNLALVENGQYFNEKNIYNSTNQNLFYSSLIGDNLIGFGIGYTYNNPSYSDYYYNVNELSGTISELSRYYYCQNLQRHSFFTNLNGKFKIDSKRYFLAGTQLYYNKDRGFQFYDEYDHFNNIFGYTTDKITYYKYDRHAYECDFTLGTAFYRTHLTKHNTNTISCTSLLYKFNKEHSLPSYVENIRPVFTNSAFNDIQFAGINNKLHDFRLDYLYSEKSPDIISTDSSCHMFRFVFNLLHLSIGISDENNITTLINKWNTNNGVGWGVTDRKFHEYMVYLNIDNSTSLFIGKYFYLNLRLYSNTNSDIDDLYHRLTSYFSVCPFIGIKKPILNTVLFDIRLMPVFLSVDVLDFDYFVFEVRSSACIQLRVSFLK